MPVIVDIEKVLVCDAVDESCISLLKQNNILVDYKLKLSESELVKEVQNYDALIVRSDTKVTEKILNASAGKLKVVGRAGAGIDNIHIDAATANKVIVLNAPGGNSISACELTCMLIASLARPITAAAESMKQGLWDRKKYAGTELSGKTLAILGLGRIGREVGIRMGAFGMKVIGYDPITTQAEAKTAGIEKMALDEIWPLADYVTVHTPLISSTKNLISNTSLAKCKKGVKIVNVARGGIVDEKALYDALENGQCGGAALDVFTEEPPKSDFLLTLLKHPKVIATPHLGASTKEAQVKVAVEVSEQFIALTGKSTTYKEYSGVINRNVLDYYQ